jgi:hypothetical protein
LRSTALEAGLRFDYRFHFGPQAVPGLGLDWAEKAIARFAA